MLKVNFFVKNIEIEWSMADEKITALLIIYEYLTP